LPQEILEEELFGTAEREDVGRPGKLELANGGTLFMDEIEKLPRSVAVMLAEALTSHTMRRMGDRVNRTINVRIVAASDCDLKRLTERGGFDESLYRIVSKNTLRVPPLRARVSDIPSLAAHIIRELAQQHTMAEKTLAEDTKKLLMSYEWPGNVKQLQEVVEHAYFNTAGAVIQPEDINLMGDVKPDMSWKEDRDVFERVWKAAGGNVSRMANMLDVSRVTLYRYLKKYGIEKK
jgi:DNA-binding NtrC family response regulator